MKKKFAFIIALSLSVIVCIGVVFAANVADNGSLKEILQPLTEEDKALQAEIAKYSDTKVDFRYNKQEKVQDKIFDISFSEFNSFSKPRRAIYKNDLDDEFEYDIATGKLIHMTLNSNITKKTNDSIDIDSAQKLALTFFPKVRNIDDYERYICVETSSGYAFWYRKNIGKYAIDDEFRIEIGFDGAVIYISDLTEVFAGKSLDFDEKFLDSKIEAFAKENDAVNIDYEHATITLRDGKLCLRFAYEIVTDGGAKSGFITEIPLE